MTESPFISNLKEEKHPLPGTSKTYQLDSMETTLEELEDPLKKPDFTPSQLPVVMQLDKKHPATTPLTSNLDPSSRVNINLYS